MLLPAEWTALQTAAREVRQRAWAPYSNFAVGAAVLTESGNIITGCNVENASYGLTICAERVAISRAIAEGHRHFKAVCVSLTGVPVPCGACRQFLMEFNADMVVLMDDASQPTGSEPRSMRLSDLLPHAFRLL